MSDFQTETSNKQQVNQMIHGVTLKQMIFEIDLEIAKQKKISYAGKENNYHTVQTKYLSHS